MANSYRAWVGEILEIAPDAAQFITDRLRDPGTMTGEEIESYKSEGLDYDGFDDPGGEPAECIYDDGSLYLHHEDWGDLEYVASVLAAAQDRFKLDGPWVVRWADWCSSLRSEEFGGGALVAHRGEVHWISVDDALNFLLKKLGSATEQELENQSEEN